MKEIKFRAWDKENKQWARPGQQLLGYVVAWKNPTEFEVERDGFEFVQYTGLKDKNGIEIYVGDIVQGRNRMRDSLLLEEEVTYLNGCFMFGNWNAHEYFNKHQEIEVIGNRYEGVTK